MPREAAAPTHASSASGAPGTDESTWLEVAIRVPAAAAEQLGQLLIDAGSAGVITGTHELARGARRRVHETVRGFFPAEDPVRARLAVEAALNELRRSLRRPPPLRAEWLSLDERLWEMDWREHFQPIAVGTSLVIVPPWDRRAHPERKRIVVHPGMAFGTGQHETTHACLEAIEALTSPPPARALDLGTGTGVLAVALAKRGVPRVDAIDTDLRAVEAARDNVKRNRVGARVRVSGRPLTAAKTARGHYPLIVANLYIDVLVALAPMLESRVAPGGHLITSGVLKTQQRRLRDAYAAPAWRVVRARRRGEWVTTVLHRTETERPAPRPRRRRS